MKTKLRTFMRHQLMSLTGYWIYKRKDLPQGFDFYEDIAKLTTVKSIDTVFDVGANMGQSVDHYLAHLPGATIYSFEPIKSTYDILQKKTEGFNNVKAFNIALGANDSSAIVKYYDGGELSGLNSLNRQSMNLSDAANEQYVEIKTIDGFARQHNISAIDLLKIDTEGYELNVLKGAAEMLKSKRIKMIYAEVGFSEKLDDRHSFLPHLVEYLFDFDYCLLNMYGFNIYTCLSGCQFANALFVEKSLIKP